MPKATLPLKKQAGTATSAAPVHGGRVFKISMKGVPPVDAKMKAALDAAARKPESMGRDYPQVIVD